MPRKRSSPGRSLSKLRVADCEPGDEIGAYTYGQLIRMDARFCAAVEAAIAAGKERRPDPQQRAA
jgi:hypothetical protein